MCFAVARVPAEFCTFIVRDERRNGSKISKTINATKNCSYPENLMRYKYIYNSYNELGTILTKIVTYTESHRHIKKIINQKI
jgi:hypothetical protein